MAVVRVKRTGAPSPKRGSAPTLTVRMPPEMKRQLSHQVIEDGYGMRGKSRWVSEALEGFLRDRSWPTQVLDGEMGVGSQDADKDVYAITAVLREQLGDALNTLRSHVQNEVMDGTYPKHMAPDVSVSAIVRGAIAWRLYPQLRMTSPEPQGEMFPEEGG